MVGRKLGVAVWDTIGQVGSSCMGHDGTSWE